MLTDKAEFRIQRRDAEAAESHGAESWMEKKCADLPAKLCDSLRLCVKPSLGQLLGYGGESLTSGGGLADFVGKPGVGGGVFCSRFLKAMTAMTHAVQVGSMSTPGMNSTANVGSNSR